MSEVSTLQQTVASFVGGRIAAPVPARLLDLVLG